MDSPEWLINILDRIHSFHSDDLDPVEAAQIICQRFEAALGQDANGGVRIRRIPTGRDLIWQHDGSNARSSEARARWYNQPGQEETNDG